eukprot:15444927-Alexandrium_andersonii.AAC.1
MGFPPGRTRQPACRRRCSEQPSLRNRPLLTALTLGSAGRTRPSAWRRPCRDPPAGTCSGW